MNLNLDKIKTRLIEKMNAGQMIRWIYFGSSNTQRRIPGMHWGDWLELACKQKYDEVRDGCVIQAFNLGVGGESSRELLGRLERDVISLLPDAVFITVGGNDAYRGMASEEYKSNLLELHQKISQTGSLVIFQTYYGCYMENSPEREMKEKFNGFMQIVRDVASETESPLIDHYSRWSEIISQQEYVDKLLMDAMHTTELGNLVLGLDLAEIFECKDFKNADIGAMMEKYSNQASEIKKILDKSVYN